MGARYVDSDPDEETKPKKRVKVVKQENGASQDQKAKPQQSMEKISKLTEQISGIKNKIVRSQQFAKLKQEKRKLKKAAQQQRRQEAKALGKDAPPKQVPRTIESMREEDITTVAVDDEEVQHDINHDEFMSYFDKVYEPKVLITCSDNPHTRTIHFVRELCKMIPNSEPRWRQRSSVKKMIKAAKENGFTDIIVVNEDRRQPNGILVSHLPEGPTAYFKMSNVRLTKDLRKDRNDITSHRPEVILNNFSTRLGQTVARLLASLFHYDPEFKGRRAVTFHNQRDYIFFRHHRYEFKSEKKVSLRELGPRFTLRLQSIQKGTFDSMTGEYDWVITGKRHEMETSRRRFFL